MSKVGFYILHYKDDLTTTACVCEVLCQGVDGSTVIVIDNGSPTPYEFPWSDSQLIIHRIDQNIKVVDALNQGMQLYPSEYYFCLNNDVFPADDCFTRLIEALDQPGVGIVAPGTSDETTGLMHQPSNDPLAISIELADVDGHCWGWKHELVEVIGYPDCENHTHQMCWGSNIDYCWRAADAGFSVMCVKSAFVDHVHEFSYDRTKALSEGNSWLRSKWGHIKR